MFATNYTKVIVIVMLILKIAFAILYELVWSCKLSSLLLLVLSSKNYSGTPVLRYCKGTAK